MTARIQIGLFDPQIGRHEVHLSCCADLKTQSELREAVQGPFHWITALMEWTKAPIVFKGQIQNMTVQNISQVAKASVELWQALDDLARVPKKKWDLILEADLSVLADPEKREKFEAAATATLCETTVEARSGREIAKRKLEAACAKTGLQVTVIS